MAAAAPNQVVARFVRRVADLTRDFDELLLAVHQKRREASLRAMLSEQTAILIAVLWETFVSEIITAYVAERPTSCLTDIENRFRKSVDEKFPGIARWVACEFPPTVSWIQAEKLLDPKGWNVAARSAQELADMANRLLEGADAKKFSLIADDRDFIDYLVGLRNYLGPRSSASRLKLIGRINAINPAGPNAPLGGRMTKIGTYLKGAVVGGGTRVNLIGARVQQVAAKLA
jgi:hypothetical protein